MEVQEKNHRTDVLFTINCRLKEFKACTTAIVLSVEGRLLKSLSRNDSNQVLPPPTPTKTSDFGDSIEGYKEDFRPTTPGSSPGVGHSFAEDVEDIAERKPSSISVQGNGNRSIAGHSPGVGHAYPNGSQNSEPNA
ncbi:hypothetical protein GOBAR_AA11112 [Gossypium barbadense]|uniref:Uncharacterized protein n=1 Tax=Gossypium barbadense TaxID=3634 RepID=A0A2P5Y1R9_GOSBA|nr:hypothetical protein GOBAR_AA11112 [Gossypium barbadense]